MSMIRRQFQVRYRQSFVGIAWALIPPILMLITASVVFRGVTTIDVGDTPYALFAMAGIVPWTLFASSMTFGILSVTNNQALVRRLAFPRAVLPLSAIGISLLDLLTAAGLFLLVAFIVGDGLPITALWAPILLLVEVALLAGICLLGSALNTFAADVRLIVPIMTQMLLFITPVMYPLDIVEGDLKNKLAYVNPMTGIVESFRRVLLEGRGPEFKVMLPSLIGAAVLLVIGSWYFSATEDRFADVI